MFRHHGKPISKLRRGGPGSVVFGSAALIALLGVNQLLVDPNQGGKVFGAGLAAVCFGYAYVMWRAARVVLFKDGVLAGTAVRPRWITWDEIAGASLQEDRGGYGQSGHVPVIRLKSGKTVKLGFFFAPNPGPDKPDLARSVVDALNAHVEPAL